MFWQRAHAHDTIFHDESSRVNKAHTISLWLQLKFSDLLLAGFHDVLGLVWGILLETRHHVVSRMQEDNPLKNHGFSLIQHHV